jgi:hypothetical protein
MDTRKIIMCCLLVVGTIPLLMSRGSAYQDNTLYEITDAISPEARQEFSDIISSFAQDIPDSHIKFRIIEEIIMNPRRPEKIVLIRLEEERFCFEANCVTIVTRKCGHSGCQYASAFLPPRYRLEVINAKFGTFIKFPKSGMGNTVVMVTNQFIASYDGL